MPPSSPSAADLYFLGGCDLEMQQIAEVLSDHSVACENLGEAWSGKLYAYHESKIAAAIRRGQRPVLIELGNIPESVQPFVDIIDHHGEDSGHVPTSLEQVLQRLGLTPTHEQQLIAANDKGYIEGMIAAGATLEEVEHIRRDDREAQKITSEQMQQAATAIAARDTSVPGLTVVQLPHGRTAAVTDLLHAYLGGPGYANLLILCPGEVNFYGDGAVITRLKHRFGGYEGGQLPVKGYWGLETSDTEQRKAIRDFVESI